MPKSSPLGAAERRELHSLLDRLSKNGHTVADIARAIGMSPGSLSNLRRNKDAGTNPERLAVLRSLVESGPASADSGRRSLARKQTARAASATKTRKRGRKRAAATTKAASPASAKSARTRRAAGKKQSSRVGRPRGASVETLGPAQLTEFTQKVRQAIENGYTMGRLSVALGYGSAGSLQTAISRKRVPVDIDRSLDALLSSPSESQAAEAAAPARTPRAARKGATRTRGRRRTSSAPGAAPSPQQDAGSAAAGVGLDAAPGSSIAARLPGTDAGERVALKPYLEDSAAHLQAARASLQSALNDGATTILTETGVSQLITLLERVELELRM